MKIWDFQICKIHSSSLRGFRITACQSWCNSQKVKKIHNLLPIRWLWCWRWLWTYKWGLRWNGNTNHPEFNLPTLSWFTWGLSNPFLTRTRMMDYPQLGFFSDIFAWLKTCLKRVCKIILKLDHGQESKYSLWTKSFKFRVI